MRIELDTKNKTVLLLENINIEELLVELESLDIDFMEWSFITERQMYFRTSTYTGIGGTGSIHNSNNCTTNKNVQSTFTK